MLNMINSSLPSCETRIRFLPTIPLQTIPFANQCNETKLGPIDKIHSLSMGTSKIKATNGVCILSYRYLVHYNTWEFREEIHLARPKSLNKQLSIFSDSLLQESTEQLINNCRWSFHGYLYYKPNIMLQRVKRSKEREQNQQQLRQRWMDGQAAAAGNSNGKTKSCSLFQRCMLPPVGLSLSLSSSLLLTWTFFPSRFIHYLPPPPSVEIDKMIIIRSRQKRDSKQAPPDKVVDTF